MIHLSMTANYDCAHLKRSASVIQYLKRVTGGVNRQGSTIKACYRIRHNAGKSPALQIAYLREALELRVLEVPDTVQWADDQITKRENPAYELIELALMSDSNRYDTASLPRVSTEMSLHVLAYNLKRMMSIFGIAGLLEAIRA
jgi:hypothetical protein